MSDRLKPSIIRVFGQNDEVIGAGILVSDKHVMTCAHVVAQSLDLPLDTSDAPACEIHFDIPLTVSSKPLTGRVTCWLPMNATGSASPSGLEDIAVIELKSDLPQDVLPARLVIFDDLWDHKFRAFGFPAGHDKGVWADGVLRDRQTDGWVQIVDVKQTGHFIAPGFSGGPVWDEQLDGVVGMVVTTDKRPDVRAAFIIPTSLLVNAWPALLERAEKIEAHPQMGIKKRAVWATVIGILLLLFIYFWNRPPGDTAALAGTVVDRNNKNKPIPGAKVTIDGIPGMHPAETSSDGVFTINDIPRKYGEGVRIRVIAEGYQPNPYTEDVVLGKAPPRVELEREE